jgi:DNA-binding NtrC family response regulator
MMQTKFNVLVIDDDPTFLETAESILKIKGFGTSTAISGEKALAKISNEEKYHLVLLDLGLPDIHGLDLLEKIKEKHRELPVYIITGEEKIQMAVKAIKLGAEDYLVKPVKPEKLVALAEKEREHQQIIDQNAYFMSELSQRYNIENIVGQSRIMQDIFKRIEVVSDSDTTVLITGESGTGKELIANHIHYSSRRRSRPLVTVSCSALAPSVFESELFGYEKGAFTGAERTYIGRFELADGGTLFLDEIGDIPLQYQTKLLRVLQTKEFERVGGNKPISSDFRLIAATNHNLEEDVRKGLFREDLYYRLRVAEIVLPPLRQRKEDIPFLLKHFIDIYANKTNKCIVGSYDEVKDVFEAHDWPGNVRELKNVVERAFVYHQEKDIAIRHLPNYIHSSRSDQSIDLSHLPTRNLAEVEKALVELCMWESGGNKSKAAEMLGIMRSTLQGKLAKYDLEGVVQVRDH